MNTAKRWYLQWWISGDDGKSRHRWYSHYCKLCAAKRAYDLGCVMADLAKVDRSNVRWTIATVRGHLTEPTIIASSGSVSLKVLKHHAHG